MNHVRGKDGLVEYEHKTREYGLMVLFLLIVLTAGGVYWQARVSITRYAELNSKLDAQVTLLASTTSSLARSIDLIDQELARTKSESSAAASSLASQLATEQANVANFQNQIQTIGNTVGTLDKLSRLDAELLKKYSKVFFLNENYVPANLVPIGTRYLYNEKKQLQLQAEVINNLNRMLDDATAYNIKIYVQSAYRSFFDQANLKGQYSVTYGAGTANTFSADQGYSEHQLGTTVDLVTTGLGGSLDGFDNTTAYTWLVGNAYKYGFVLSYPKGNDYYVFEPWHWRFVGRALALRMHNEGKNFYDMDQRVIDSYLIHIFD